MDKKRASETGIRMEIIEGENEAVAVDALIDDLLHGNMTGALNDLHEPHSLAHHGSEHRIPEHHRAEHQNPEQDSENPVKS